jgi:hypothetical protein
MPGKSFTTAWHNSLMRFEPSFISQSCYAFAVERGYEEEYHFRQAWSADYYRFHGSDFYMPLVVRIWMKVIERHGITLPQYMPYVVLPPYTGTQMVDIITAIDESRRQRTYSQAQMEGFLSMLDHRRAIENPGLE